MPYYGSMVLLLTQPTSNPTALTNGTCKASVFNRLDRAVLLCDHDADVARVYKVEPHTSTIIDVRLGFALFLRCCSGGFLSIPEDGVQPTFFCVSLILGAKAEQRESNFGCSCSRPSSGCLLSLAGAGAEATHVEGRALRIDHELP